MARNTSYPDYYLTGQDGGDNQYLFMGLDRDVYRWGVNDGAGDCQPRQDTPGADIAPHLRQRHANGFNMAFCDGSIQTMSYSLDCTIHAALCNRHDGLAIDGKKF